MYNTLEKVDQNPAVSMSVLEVGDIPSVVRLFSVVIGASPDYSDHEKAQSIGKRDVPYYMDKIDKSDWIILCARSGGQVIGFIEVNIEKDDLSGELYAHSRWLIIDKNYQGGGVGTFLKRNLEERLKGMSIKEIRARIKPSNEISLRVSQTLGYSRSNHPTAGGMLEFYKYI